MSPRFAARTVTIVFLIALEILNIQSSANAFVIKQDPKRLAAVMAELELLGEGTGGSKDDALKDKMIDMKTDGKSQSIVPIETTAKTEEIQKSTLETKPLTILTNKSETTTSIKVEISTTNIPETTTNGKLDTITTYNPQEATTSEIRYSDGHLTTNAPTQTTIDFLLDNTETESSGDTSSTTTKVIETTERNIKKSYSTEAVKTNTNAHSDSSSTIEIDDDSRRNTPNVTEITPSSTTLTTQRSQNRDTAVTSKSSTINSDILTTDVKPLQKKYMTIDRKRNNVMAAETVQTTETEIELATAETKHQNTDKNINTFSTPEWYYVNIKQDITSPIKTDSSAISYSTNEYQAQTTNEVVTDNSEHLVSPLIKLPKMENTPSTETTTETVTSTQYSLGLTNLTIIQSSQELKGTTKAITNTDTTSTASTQFMSTGDNSQNPTTTEPPTIETKTDQILSTSDVSSLRSPRAYNVTEATKSVDSVRGTNEITSETTKSVLTSKRAGYLNMSSKPASRTETTIANERTTTVIGDAKKSRPAAADPVSTTDRKVYYMQSQSQLAEDAINEELMKEEMMNDQIGYTQQNREQRKDKDLSKNVTTDKAPTTTDDILSVKPIGVDKQKNNNLYTVSPNYRPMKKIEVQPPKPFVRDPDDNSWRNESLSSLGIVFKANNSSKPLTQVLKNKTETEFNSLLDNYGKTGEPELRTRLEKIAEQRKTKKKVGEKSVETSYGDSDDIQNFFAESSSMSTPEVYTVEVVPSVSPIPKSTAVLSSTTEEPDNFVKSTISIRDREDPNRIGYLTALPPKKYNSESFDGSDEEPDYSSLSNIDIKKTSVKKIENGRNNIGPIQTAIPPERKATVQYFPPRGTPPTKVNLNDYDYDFKRKIQALEQDKLVSPLVYSSSPTPAPIKQDIPSTQRQQSVKDFRLTVTDVPGQQFTNVVTSETPRDEGQDGFNGASYVIKHLRDFIHLAARESDEDRAAYLTEPPRAPVHSATAHGYLKDNKVKPSDYEDYDTHFRKHVLDKFVENFNQNSERFKVDFPVLYNTSIIHSNFADESKQASSSAFMKRLYGTPRVSRGPAAGPGDPGCDRAVELAPEYELHYYVPEQEEREVAPAHADELLSPVRYQLRL